MVRPAARREVARYLQLRYEVSERRACRTIMFLRSTLRYRSRLDPRTALRIRMRDIAHTRVRYGYRRVRVMLLREGWQVSKNLVYRLYREEGLALRTGLRRRRRAPVQRQARAVPTAPNHAWTLDFVSDQLVDGARFRALTVLDIHTRQCLAIEIGDDNRRKTAQQQQSAQNEPDPKRDERETRLVENGLAFSNYGSDVTRRLEAVLSVRTGITRRTGL